ERLTGCLVISQHGHQLVCEPLKAVARFHIHPSIVLHQSDGEYVLLTAPDGESWLFSAPGNEVLIAEDIFFADSSGICGSDQI
ncbi:heparinase II/III family protein, partial [Rhizobium ruizarguesonis]